MTLQNLSVLSTVALGLGFLTGCPGDSTCEDGSATPESGVCEEDCDAETQFYSDDVCVDIEDEDCDDGEDNDGDGDVDCRDEDCDTDDACVEVWEPTSFWAESTFGYNMTTDEAMPFTALDSTGAEQAINPTVIVTLASDAYFDNFDDFETCIVFFEYAGTVGLASWVTAAGVNYGFDAPADAGVQTNCDQQPFDQMIYGPDMTATIGAHVWGGGVLPISAEIQTALKDAVDADPSSDWATDFEPFVLGGGYYLSLVDGQPDFPGGFVDSGIAYAFALDGEFKTIPDAESGGDTRLLAADILGGTATAAAFNTTAFGALGPAEALAGR